MDKFKGLTIELVSKADIKYKGILQDIDPVKSEITLIKVKCLGSATKGIVESARIFESIRFKSSDIQDLVIDEKVEQQMVEKEPFRSSNSKTSNIIEMDDDQLDEDQLLNEPLEKPKPRQPIKKDNKIARKTPVKNKVETAPLQLDSSEDESPSLDRNTNYNNRQSNRQNKPNRARGRGRGIRGRGRGGSKQNIPKEDFDFATNIERFEKLNLEQEADDKVEKAYDKQSSFFDRLSNERATINRHEEREMNMETFGSARVYRPRRRGGNRGRGRYTSNQTSRDYRGDSNRGSESK